MHYSYYYSDVHYYILDEIQGMKNECLQGMNLLVIFIQNTIQTIQIYYIYTNLNLIILAEYVARKAPYNHMYIRDF